MKRQKFRMKLTALLLVCLFLLLALGGVRSLSTYGSRWFSYSGNPRLSARKQDTVMGDILDRRGVLLASTEEGKRVYASSPSVRSALVHLLGDRGGRIENGVETFHAAYLYGWSSSLADAVRRLTRPREARKGNSITLTVDADLCSRIPGWFESHPLSAGRSGAAVVMNYLTGEIAAMVSLPVFDPDQEDGALPAGSDSAFRNRAVHYQDNLRGRKCLGGNAPQGSVKMLRPVSAVHQHQNGEFISHAARAPSFHTPGSVLWRAPVLHRIHHG